jgi:hypothetical protein
MSVKGEDVTTIDRTGVKVPECGNESTEAIDEVIRHWLLNLAVEIPLALHRVLPAVQAQDLIPRSLDH